MKASVSNVKGIVRKNYFATIYNILVKYTSIRSYNVIVYNVEKFKLSRSLIHNNDDNDCIKYYNQQHMLRRLDNRSCSYHITSHHHHKQSQQHHNETLPSHINDYDYDNIMLITMNRKNINQLEIFPEYKLIIANNKKAKFHFILLSLHRLYDILINSLGLYHILTYEIIYSLVIINNYLDNYNQSIQYINNLNINVDNVINTYHDNDNNNDNDNSIQSFIKFLQLKSICLLLNNNSSLALKTSFDALTLCEHHQQQQQQQYQLTSNKATDIVNTNGFDIDQLSSCNTTIGICYLFNNNQVQHSELVNSVNSSSISSSRCIPVNQSSSDHSTIINNTSNIDTGKSGSDSNDNILTHSMNYDDAIGYLQIAARWAKTPYDQLISLSNLGK
jgi:hypothetical protein